MERNCTGIRAERRDSEAAPAQHFPKAWYSEPMPLSCHANQHKPRVRSYPMSRDEAEANLDPTGRRSRAAPEGHCATRRGACDALAKSVMGLISPETRCPSHVRFSR